ncbi:nucleotide sugar epimerase/dehydratase [alpha proteobacterium U9-1i]|nr:nucleotide sugar epimerase/dehydratase [alpha proteobacterium U9-1i]
MRLLITGGAGCLGANIVERYLTRGDDLLVLDNFATSRREALPAESERLQVIEGTVLDAELVLRACADFVPTAVIHAAASYKDPGDWRGDLAINGQGTINVVEAAKAAGVMRFVNLQTALCYGRPDTTPIPVSAPLRPFTSYGVSKVAGEHYVLMSGLNAVSLRIANVTGPRLSIGPIPTFYTRLKAGKGCFCSDATRDFLDMSDFLALLDLAIEADAPRGVFHASSGEGRTISQVFDGVAGYLGLTPEPPPIVPVGDDDVPSVVLDPSKTTRQFGWRAKTSFEASLNTMLAWYDTHGVRDVYAHVAKPEGFA